MVALIKLTFRYFCPHLWHIGHNDANDKDDGLNPVVAHGHGDDEEDEAEGEGYASDEVDKLADLKRGVEGQFCTAF